MQGSDVQGIIVDVLSLSCSVFLYQWYCDVYAFKADVKLILCEKVRTLGFFAS
jgi:hypothetical protein